MTLLPTRFIITCLLLLCSFFGASLFGQSSWTLVGPERPTNNTNQFNGSGRLNCVAFHPNDPNILYAGSPAGGFWISTNGGQSWSNSSSGLGAQGVSTIAVHPTNPDTIFIGTGDRDQYLSTGKGVWKSTDAGATWESTNGSSLDIRTVNKLLVNPINPNKMVAATSGNIYLSNDGGITWNQASGVNYDIKDIAFHPTNPDIVYGARKSFIKSIDGGQTWNTIYSGIYPASSRMAIAVSEDEPNWVYAISGSDNTGLQAIFRSENSGIDFSTLNNTSNVLGALNYGSNPSSSFSSTHLVIAVDPTNANTFYTGCYNVWKSIDGGNSASIASFWYNTSYADGMFPLQTGIEFSPHNNDIYVTGSGGLYYSNDQSTTWNDISGNLTIATIHDISMDNDGENSILASAHESGSIFFEGDNSATIFPGSSSHGIIDPNNPDILYINSSAGIIRRSMDGGNTFTSITTDITETGAYIEVFELASANTNLMYLGRKDIYRNSAVQTEDTWVKISSFSGTSNIHNLTIAPTNNDVIYVSRYNGTFYQTSNGSAVSPTWTDITSSLPIANDPSAVAIGNDASSHLFIGISNQIFESTDGGDNWTDISSGINTTSTEEITNILIDPENINNGMYISLKSGEIYYKDNTMNDWIDFSSGMPNTPVSDLMMHHSNEDCNSQLYAATLGRGLWKSAPYAINNIAPTACFTSSKTTACIGETIELIDRSFGIPTSWQWNITPNTFSFEEGTNENSSLPIVRFLASNQYTIELIVTNEVGSDTEAKTNYITIEALFEPCEFTENFDTQTPCSTVSDCGITTCALFGKWQNVSIDDIDWRTNTGSTVTSGTGPSSDTTLGTELGVYAYLEGSGCFESTASLESKCINLNQNYTLSFAYHMYGSGMGSLHVDIYDDGEWHHDITPALEGDQGNQWNYLTVDLSAWTGKTVRLRIRGITGLTYASDIAIDDIQLINGLPETTLINSCEPITSPDGTTLWSINGLYADTITTAAGCDSIVVVDLHIYEESANVEDEFICPGDDYTYPDGTVSNNITATETHTSILSGQSSSGCDSSITTTLHISETYDIDRFDTLCYGGSYPLPGGKIQHNITETFTHTYLGTSSLGCDSVIRTHLEVIEINTNVSVDGPKITALAPDSQFQWIDCFDNSTIAEETSNEFIATYSGSFASVISKKMCTDTTECESIILVGLGKPNDQTMAFPNPTAGLVHIPTTGDYQILSIEITDSQGKPTPFTETENADGSIIYLEGESGIYLIQVTTIHGTQQIQVFKN